MAFPSLSTLSAVRRLPFAHVHPFLRSYRQGIRYRTNQSFVKLPVRNASQWNRRRPSPSYNSFRPGYALWRTSPIFRLTVGVLGVGGGIFYLSNLEKVPVTGRRRFNFISPQLEAALSQSGFEQVVQAYGDRILPANHPYSRLVNRVVARLLPVSGVQNQNWEVRVIDAPDEKNAFVMPGGKIFVFSGILPICEGEDGLAHVLGHEIGHNAAHHVAEKLSKAAPQQVLALVLSLFFEIPGSWSQGIVDIALSKTNSRTQESEADYLGLLMVAKACFDPRAAVGLWRRMAQAEKSERFATPQFLSTHPASQDRMKRIEHWLPEATDIQSKSNCGRIANYCKFIDLNVSNAHLMLDPTVSLRISRCHSAAGIWSSEARRV